MYKMEYYIITIMKYSFIILIRSDSYVVNQEKSIHEHTEHVLGYTWKNRENTLK